MREVPVFPPGLPPFRLPARPPGYRGGRNAALTTRDAWAPAGQPPACLRPDGKRL